MFGKKAQRIRELQAKNASQTETIFTFIKENETLSREATALRTQVEYLVRTIRQMDDQIFAMSQKAYWLQMLPHFQTLNDGMISRKVAESDGIADIVRPELIETYTPKGLDRSNADAK